MYSLRSKVSESDPTVHYDPTSKLIIEEAQRRGISVEVLSPRAEYFRLRQGSKAILCRESLSELTSAVALSLCHDKRTTSYCLTRAGLRVPRQIVAEDLALQHAFLKQHGSIVVKPASGEQGRGVSVGIRTEDALRAAVERAVRSCDVVLLEEQVMGEDVRIIVIGDRMVAAAVRRPPEVVGTGDAPISALIAAQSEKRAAETSGASRIPLDAETERCVREAGYALNDVLPVGRSLVVRGNANVHTGGTIHDVTRELNPQLAHAARQAARALGIPVVGLDLIVPSLSGTEYAILEANERPGLANHEPQPTAARFVDLLFPGSIRPSAI